MWQHWYGKLSCQVALISYGFVISCKIIYPLGLSERAQIQDDVQYRKGGGGQEYGLMQCKIFFQKHGSKGNFLFSFPKSAGCNAASGRSFNLDHTPFLHSIKSWPTACNNRHVFLTFLNTLTAIILLPLFIIQYLKTYFGVILFASPTNLKEKTVWKTKA